MTAQPLDPDTVDPRQLETKALSLAVTNDVIAGIIAEITVDLTEQIKNAVDKAVRREFLALALACADCPSGGSVPPRA